MLCGGDYDIQLERCTAIILYNIATCHIHSTKDVFHNMNTNNNKTSSSSLVPLKLLTLSLNKIQEMLSRIDIINEDTIQTWYGIHQIEYCILMTMKYLVTYNFDVYVDGVNNHNIMNHQQYVSECIIDRIHNVRTILRQNQNTVHFLGSLTSSSSHTAPSA